MPLAPGRYFGHTATPRSVSGFRLSEIDYHPSQVIPRHDHELAGFCLVSAGAYDETFGRRNRSCQAGTLVVHPAGEHHSEVHRACTVRLLSVEIGAEKHAQLSESISVLKEPRHFTGGALVQLSRRLESELRAPDSASNLVLEGLILELLALEARHAAPPRRQAPPWLARAEAFMRAHFKDSLSVTDIARAAGVHPAHLARGFREHTRSTVGDRLRGLRLEWAMERLRTTEQPLSEVALDAGFSDQSHFTRLFRRAVGTTPQRWRQAQR